MTKRVTNKNLKNIITNQVNQSIINQKDKIEKLMEKIELFYKQVKKNEKSPATDYLFKKTEERSNIEKKKNVNFFRKKQHSGLKKRKKNIS